jgi:hypothetical protein
MDTGFHRCGEADISAVADRYCATQRIATGTIAIA